MKFGETAMSEAAVVFTAKSIERLLSEGGTSSWRLDRNRARQCAFAVCTRNAYADWVEGPEAHHSAFLVAKVKDVVPSPENDDRYLIQFSEYALVDIPEFWKGDRNPIRYVPLHELGIDLTTVKWEPMPEPAEPSEAAPDAQRNRAADMRLTMAEAKHGLALTFGVPPEAIEITIRG
jgi:hypothetical protein